MVLIVGVVIGCCACFTNWDKIVDEYEKPCVFIKIGYTQGLNGSNILVLKGQAGGDHR